MENKPLVLNKQHGVMYHLVSEFQLMLLLLTTVKIVNRARTALGWRSRGRDRSEEGLAGFGVLFLCFLISKSLFRKPQR